MVFSKPIQSQHSADILDCLVLPVRCLDSAICQLCSRLFLSASYLVQRNSYHRVILTASEEVKFFFPE